jgi:GNAT superfamily N-acetyltransferase
MVGEAVMRVAVDVTFLRMDAPPTDAAPQLPEAAQVLRVPACSVPFYRYLYNTVGGPWLWWLRRVMPDADLAAHLSRPNVGLRVLYRGGEPAGFYELEGRGDGSVNLSYFGLMPQVIGQGLGRALLRHAVDIAWRSAARAVTVNTCTADHPRALPNYIAAGFRPLRTVPELWPVPCNLGMQVPARLLAHGESVLPR